MTFHQVRVQQFLLNEVWNQALQGLNLSNLCAQILIYTQYASVSVWYSIKCEQAIHIKYDIHRFVIRF